MRSLIALIALIALPAPVALCAQGTPRSAGARLPKPSNQVLSVQPLWSPAGAFMGEFERRVSSKWTLGVGGTYWSKGYDFDRGGSAEVKYASGDVKLRYYPGGRALQGLSLGGQAGYTRVHGQAADSATARSAEGSAGGASMGMAFDYNWLLGASNAFYLGMGVGVKGLFIDKESIKGVALAYPTARMSVGWAF